MAKKNRAQHIDTHTRQKFSNPARRVWFGKFGVGRGGARRREGGKGGNLEKKFEILIVRKFLEKFVANF
jgi:hypothetical protein